MPEVRIIAKNFMDMVASMPAMKLDKLYENAFICEAILRLLLFSFYLSVIKFHNLFGKTTVEG
jgi:hypothetical protein